jgi:TerB-C domain
MAETDRAASILAGIFTGENTSSFSALGSPAAPPAPRGGASPAAPGLDAAHQAFARKLADRPSWPRGEVEDIAAGLGLMTDGALEIVNEAAFDIADAPAWEGRDPVVVNIDVVEEILP